MDVLNRNPTVVIARTFNALPEHVKLMEDKKEFMYLKIISIDFYDFNEFFIICRFVH